MKITITIYNDDKSDCYRIFVENNQTMIKNPKGVLFISDGSLFDVLDEAYGDKLFDGME